MTCQICHQNHPSLLHIDRKERVEQNCSKKEAGEAAKVALNLVSLDAGSHTGAGNSECKLSVVSV